MSAHGWITTTLILMPLIAAMVIWILPMPRVWIGPATLAIALAEILFWIEAVARFDFDKGGLQESNQATWSKDLSFSYHVGMFEGFSLWLVGLTVVVLAAAACLAAFAQNPVAQEAAADARFDPVRADTMLAVNFALGDRLGHRRARRIAAMKTEQRQSFPRT